MIVSVMTTKVESVETVETQVMIEQTGQVSVAPQRLSQIVDVDQPRYEEDFPIDWVKLGCAVKRKVKAVANLIYNDDRADLAEIINNYGPADIDLHGMTGAGDLGRKNGDLFGHWPFLLINRRLPLCCVSFQ